MMTDYGDLSTTELAKQINADYDLILESERTTLQRYLAMGEKLIALRPRIAPKHGEWQAKLKLGQGSAAQLVMIATTLMSAGRPLRRTEHSNVWSGQLIFLALQYNLRLMKLTSATQYDGEPDAHSLSVPGRTVVT